MLDPGHDRAVVEPDDQLHPHRDPAAPPLDTADEVMPPPARRHAVDHGDGPVVGLELGLQDERTLMVPAAGGADGAGGGQEPAAVLGGAQQGGEAGGRVEARHAQPIDRAVARHQGARLAVADQRVVLDAARHGVARDAGVRAHPVSHFSRTGPASMGTRNKA